MQRGRFVSLRRRRQIQQNYFVGFRCCLCGRIFCCLCARAYFDEIRPVLTSVWSRYEEALRPGLAQEYLVLKVVIALLPVSLLFLYLPRHRSIGLALGLPVRSKILASFARLDGSETVPTQTFGQKLHYQPVWLPISAVFSVRMMASLVRLGSRTRRRDETAARR